MKKKKNEFNYFDEFVKSAELAKEVVNELKKYIDNFSKIDSEEEMKKIHELENKGDDNLHELKNYLLKDFLPPIDREDILNLAYELDDLIDNIDEVVIDLNIYNVTQIKENMKNSIELLLKATESIYNLITELKNLKKIQEIKDKVVEVNTIEEEADRLYEKSTQELYKEEKEVVEILKWSNIYETIEDCFDACESIAYSVEEILVKNT